MARETKNKIKLLEKNLERANLEWLNPEEYLKAHPMAVEVQVELEAAEWLSDEREKIDIRKDFIEDSRRKLITHALTIRKKRPRPFSAWIYLFRRTETKVFALALLILMVLQTGRILIDASSYALPGDRVYVVKRFVEDVQMLASFDLVQDANLSIRFAEKRAMEIEELVLEERYELIQITASQLEGEVERSGMLLAKLEERSPGQSQALLDRLHLDLSQQTVILSVMKDMVPNYTKTGMELAIHITETPADSFAVFYE